MALTASSRSGSGFGSPDRRRVRPTLHVAGLSLLLLVPGLGLSLLIEWGSSESDNEIALLLPMVLCGLLGGLAWKTTTIGVGLTPASVFSAVVSSWIACSLMGTLPYLLGDMFAWAQFDSALFESISGFSTTGSTVLEAIEGNGRGVLMWRQLTQWYGGMGIIVLAVTVLPSIGVSGLSLMSAEAPGPESDRLVPRVSETARRLWVVYGGLTALITVLLWVLPRVLQGASSSGVKPNLYDAFAHALTTAATGGFSTYDRSVGYFDSLVVELVIVVMLVVCAMNFALHYRALREPSVYMRASEPKLYLIILVICTALITLFVWGSAIDAPTGSVDTSFGNSLRHATFNVVAVSTTGGFGSAQGSDTLGNFVLWGPAAQMVLLALMGLGGSVGSTAGGIKVHRLQIAISHMIRQIKKIRHPQSITPVRVGRDIVSDQIMRRVFAFLSAMFMLFIFGTILLAAFGTPLNEAATGIISALSTVGPALGEAGPTANFTFYTRPGRMVIAAFMIIGRLEIFAVLLMFSGVLRNVRRRRHEQGWRR